MSQQNPHQSICAIREGQHQSVLWSLILAHTQSMTLRVDCIHCSERVKGHMRGQVGFKEREELLKLEDRLFFLKASWEEAHLA